MTSSVIGFAVHVYERNSHTCNSQKCVAPAGNPSFALYIGFSGLTREAPKANIQKHRGREQS